MLRRGTLIAVLAASATAIAIAVGSDPAVPTRPPTGAAEPRGSDPKGPRLDMEIRTFMRRKLDASSQILEGLAVEDLALVRAGANTLVEMSTAEKWRVSTDALYRQHSADFREIAQQLSKAADEGNMDRAALKWVDATMSCLECHRYVRGMRIVDGAAR
jgi:hypothetical protein